MAALQTFLTATSIHFTGICGVGMTALALCAQDLEKQISGSDTGEGFVTSDLLANRAIPVSTGFKPEHIPPETSLLIYTGAHQGPNNPEVVSAKDKHIRVIPHAQALGEAMQGKTGIGVCGVGGKTTTSAMIATILHTAGLKPSYAIGVGKIPSLPAPGKYDSGSFFVAEADEYVTAPGFDATPRFLHLTPSIAVCTGIAHDHPDQYSDLAASQRAFETFFAQLPSQGTIIACGDSQPLMEVLGKNKRVRVIRYGQGSHNDWILEGIEVKNQRQQVSVSYQQKRYQFELQVPGKFNALNALAASIVGELAGLSHKQIGEGLQTFQGTQRRFELIKEKKGTLFYDDYAHHPSEIVATLTAAKEWFPGKRIIAVFQPHTFSRTKALLAEFEQSFAAADEVVVADIFASAREAFDPDISAQVLVDQISKHHPQVQYAAAGLVAGTVERMLTGNEVVITLGAGDIYKLHDQW